jgi:hypothetical protein
MRAICNVRIICIVKKRVSGNLKRLLLVVKIVKISKQKNHKAAKHRVIDFFLCAFLLLQDFGFRICARIHLLIHETFDSLI